MEYPVSIPEHCYPLYISILRSVLKSCVSSKDTAPAFFESDPDADNRFDSYFFYNWVRGIPEDSQTLIAFDHLLEKNQLIRLDEKEKKKGKIKYIKQAWRAAAGKGFSSFETAQNIFEGSAKLAKKTVFQHMVGYLKYSWDLGANLYGARGFEKLMDDLIEDHDQILSYADPFVSTIKRHQKSYFPRKYAENLCTTFLKDNENGAFFVRADAGAGKSALMSSITSHVEKNDQYLCFWYFNTVGTAYSSSIIFLRTLTDRLSSIIDLNQIKPDLKSILNSELSDWQLYTDKLLQAVSDKMVKLNKKFVLIVDALDEINDKDKSISNYSENALCLPQNLPSSVIFILSSRNGNNQKFHTNQGLISLDADQGHQRQDIKAYITQQTQSHSVKDWMDENKISDEKLIDLLCKKSQYRFIYLHHLFSHLNEFGVTSLPDGIEAYYQVQYERLLNKQGRNAEIGKCIIAGLWKFPSGMSSERLAVLCGISVVELKVILNRWFEIKLIRSELIDGYVFYKFSHLSFYDYLSKHGNIDQIIAEYRSSFEALGNAVYADIDLSDETKLIYKKSFSPEMKKETLTMLYDAYFVAMKPDKLSEILTSSAYITDIMGTIGNRYLNVMIKASETFNQLQQLGNNEQARQFVSNFIAASLDENHGPIDLETFKSDRAFQNGPFFDEVNIIIEDTRSLRDNNKIEEGLKANMNDIKAIKLKEKQLKREIGLEKIDAYYELGQTELLLGNQKKSAKGFKKCLKQAIKIDDHKWIAVGQFMVNTCYYYIQKIDAQTYLDITQKSLSIISDLASHDNTQNLESWIYNMRKRLAIVNLDIGEIKASEYWIEKTLSSSQHQAFANATKGNSVVYPRMEQELWGKLAYIKGQHKVALHHFAKFIGCDLSKWGKRDAILQKEFSDTYETAGPVYFTACTLLELGEDNLALELLEKVDSLNDNVMSHLHKFLIKEKIKELQAV